MQILNSSWTAIKSFLQPRKTIFYDSILTQEELFNTVKLENRKNDKFSIVRLGSAGYSYKIQQGTIFVRPGNPLDTRNPSAVIKIINSDSTGTKVSTTYYRPIKIALFILCFCGTVSFFIGWPLLVVCMFLLVLNYLTFFIHWGKLEWILCDSIKIKRIKTTR